MTLTRRLIGAASRRLDRPELLAAFYAGARREQRETIALGAVLAAALPPRGTYVDVGTNRGQVLRTAVRIAPEARHIAFEPVPELAEQLKRDFASVDCRALALAERAGEREFCHFRDLDGWSGLRRSPQVSDERGRPEYITVAVSTLDQELDGAKPDVVKIDVEGAELAVLAGARSLLRDARPLLIFEHFADAAALYDARPEEMWNLLHEFAYEIFSITGEGPYTREAFAKETAVLTWLARPDRGRPAA